MPCGTMVYRIDWHSQLVRYIKLQYAMVLCGEHSELVCERPLAYDLVLSNALQHLAIQRRNYIVPHPYDNLCALNLLPFASS
mmetsp:Transcript_10161/g.21370  ORF Transcript_10161/g.21370 Transcript_10161/m.21370 type:complete len:82 (-) Transcript_10161:630-875(-)